MRHMACFFVTREYRLAKGRTGDVTVTLAPMSARNAVEEYPNSFVTVESHKGCYIASSFFIVWCCVRMNM